MAASILGFSLPTFWVGLMLILVFFRVARLAADLGPRADGESPRDPAELPHGGGLRHLVLPRKPGALNLSLVIRLTRSGTPRSDAAGLRALRARQRPDRDRASSRHVLLYVQKEWYAIISVSNSMPVAVVIHCYENSWPLRADNNNRYI